MTTASPMTLTFIQSQVRLKRNHFLTCNTSDTISALTFKLGMTVDLWMALDLTLTLNTFVRLVLLFLCVRFFFTVY